MELFSLFLGILLQRPWTNKSKEPVGDRRSTRDQRGGESCWPNTQVVWPRQRTNGPMDRSLTLWKLKRRETYLKLFGWNSIKKHPWPRKFWLGFCVCLLQGQPLAIPKIALPSFTLASEIYGPKS